MQSKHRPPTTRPTNEEEPERGHPRVQLDSVRDGVGRPTPLFVNYGKLASEQAVPVMVSPPVTRTVTALPEQLTVSVVQCEPQSAGLVIGVGEVDQVVSTVGCDHVLAAEAEDLVRQRRGRRWCRYRYRRTP